ncbi:hypothetical protein XENOCAPTIV_005809 [Xenoophorus captivus]|uniref:Uncharacterized protein n=1 Tax=Xenoophorus captivus TaxID=1517983 RepID=A0ABV0S7N1_9TELE
MEIQNLFRQNGDIISTAKHLGYEVIDTFTITMGRYKEFLQGRCACHFHEVEKVQSSKPPDNVASTRNKGRITRTGPEPDSQSTVLDAEQNAGSNTPTFHVRGAVNQVYSEILLSRLCPESRETGNSFQDDPLGPAVLMWKDGDTEFWSPTHMRSDSAAGLRVPAVLQGQLDVGHAAWDQLSGLKTRIRLNGTILLSL